MRVGCEVLSGVVSFALVHNGLCAGDVAELKVRNLSGKTNGTEEKNLAARQLPQCCLHAVSGGAQKAKYCLLSPEPLFCR